MDTNLFRYIWTHSRREQIFVLGLIALSLPFYWMSLDVPKRIVNEALQGQAFEGGKEQATLFAFEIPLPELFGGGSFTLSEGFAFDQIGYLLALSFLFLFFVLCNGAFKFAINVNKGILAERMLRRMRFDLFNRLMRFRPERVRTVKPAEAASMINNEVEPIGGFIGDAFIQPAFLSTQALTALLFIVVQSLWLGLVALSVVLIQAFVIPYLRREQLRLGRLRQIASRQLAGRIGETVDQSRLIHAHGLQNYMKAEIADRLSKLFFIRAALFKRKFAVKYLNNFLAQITPFFFYAIGGYLALTGNLDIGQLVAVIAAYRDLPPPIKELIDWDQRRADVSIKYEQVISQFESGPTTDLNGTVEAQPAPDAPLRIESLHMADQRGTTLIDAFSVTIPRPAHIAIVGPSSSGRDLLARALARQITAYNGHICIGDTDLLDFSERAAAELIGYAPPDPILFAGTARENIAIALRRHEPEPGEVSEVRWLEARRSGNPLVSAEADWHDYAFADAHSTDELQRRIIECIDIVGMASDLYAFGLQGRAGDIADHDVFDKLIEARQLIQQRLRENNLANLITPFRFDAFNAQATLAENLVFGVVASDRLAGMGLASDAYFRTILAAEALERPLTEIGLRIAENAVEVFADLPQGHPLFERFSMIASSELPAYAELVELADTSGINALTPDGRNTLMTLALAYIEPQHRLGLVTPAVQRRVLRARESFRRYLPQEYEAEIEFYSPDVVMKAAPLRDNLLFGRVTRNVANAEKRVFKLMDATLQDLGLTDTVYALGLDYEVGPAGRALYAEQRAAISLARNLIQHNQILVLEDALDAFATTRQESILAAIRERMAGRTFITTLDTPEQAEGFDVVITFNGPRATFTGAIAPARRSPSARTSDAEEDRAPDNFDDQAGSPDATPAAARPDGNAAPATDNQPVPAVPREKELEK